MKNLKIITLLLLTTNSNLFCNSETSTPTVKKSNCQKCGARKRERYQAKLAAQRAAKEAAKKNIKSKK